MQHSLLEIYQKLYQYFGPRHWWPAETPFEVCVGAILTQNVAWKNVEQAISNLKARDALSLHALIELPQDELGLLIRPTRYYNQKALKLKTLCSLVLDKYNGELTKLFALEKEDLRKELLNLKGIGEETADSIILYAAHKPAFVVDAYTRRIFSRLGFFKPDVSYGEMQRFFVKCLPEDPQLFNEYHALIVSLGNGMCISKNPKCSNCPLTGLCPKKNLF